MLGECRTFFAIIIYFCMAQQLLSPYILYLIVLTLPQYLKVKFLKVYETVLNIILIIVLKFFVYRQQVEE